MKDNLSKTKILFWVPGGMPLMLHFEGAIANALKYRGHDVHAVICDGSFRACVKREIKDNVPVSSWTETCANCKASTSSVLDQLGVSYSYIGSYVPPEERELLWEKAKAVTWDGLEDLSYGSINIGKNIQSSIIRYLQGESFNGDREVVLEYVFSAFVSASAAKKAYELLSPDKIYMSHGTYVDWGPALQLALRLRVPVVAWMASYLTSRFYFRHVEDGIRIDFHNLNRGTWNQLKNYALSLDQKQDLVRYLNQRYLKNVSFDMKKFQSYTGASEQLRNKFQIRSKKPVWGIMCHINWDAVSDYSPMAYSSFDDWIIDTVKEISKIDDVDWLIKVHPAESWDNPMTGVQALLEKNFPNLPAHIRIIKADEAINPLDFFQMIDGGVTVYGTSGLELSLHGKPVILAGEAHYGDKGFTHDGLTPEVYRNLLRGAGALEKLSEDQVELARIYAYCYFIKRQIPFPVVKDPDSIWWSYQPHKAKLLKPGKDPFTDFICDRILDGEDFIMSNELVKRAETVYKMNFIDNCYSLFRKIKRIIRKLLPEKLVCMIKQRTF